MLTSDDTAEILEEISKIRKERSDAELYGWLERDTWTAEEGLLLFVGMDPCASVVEWGGWVSSLGGKVNKVRILNARPLSRPLLFFSISRPADPQFSNLIETSPGTYTAEIERDTTTDAQDEEVKWGKVAILQELEEKLTRVHNLWISGQHDEQRYPVAYFIEWAQKKRVEVPWLAYALEREWLPASMDQAPPVVQSEKKHGEPETRPQQQQQWQEKEILRVVAELGYTAKALPKNQAGKSGVKLKVRTGLSIPDGKFNKAWERLRNRGDIQDAP